MLFEVHSKAMRKMLGSTWAGATPASSLPRRLIAALVAPAHVLSGIQKVSGTDISMISAGSFTDPGGIRKSSTANP